MSETNRTPDDETTPAGTPAGTPGDAPAETQPTLPIHSGSAQATTAQPAVPTQDPPAVAAHGSGPGAPRRRGRTALIAGGAVLGAVLLAGGGVAIGAAIADDDDDDRVSARASDEGAPGGRDGAGDRDASGDGDASGGGAGDASGGAATGTLGAASADQLDSIAEAATGVAEGQPVSIDANRDGSWDVQLRAADGSETEVRIDTAGTASVRETEAADGDDTAPGNVLDAATLRILVEAALAETDGTIVEVDADDDSRSPFDVSVLTGDGRTVDIELATDGTVIRSEVDD